MTDTCFSSLLTHAENFDVGIKKLTETWRYPHNILAGCEADGNLAQASLHELKSEINTLKQGITDNEKSRSSYMIEMAEFMEKWQTEVDDLGRMCNQIETVLSEYGYVRMKDESSKTTLDMTDGLSEVEFTPDMTWRHKARTNSSRGKSESPSASSLLVESLVDGITLQ